MKTIAFLAVTLLAAASIQPVLAQKSGPSPAGPLHPRLFNPHRDPPVRTVHESPAEVGVRNELPKGAINAGIYKDGKLLATKSAGPNHHATPSGGHTPSAVTAGRPVNCGPVGVYKDGKLLISKSRC